MKNNGFLINANGVKCGHLFRDGHYIGHGKSLDSIVIRTCDKTVNVRDMRLVDKLHPIIGRALIERILVCFVI